MPSIHQIHAKKQDLSAVKLILPEHLPPAPLAHLRAAHPSPRLLETTSCYGDMHSQSVCLIKGLVKTYVVLFLSIDFY